MNLAAGWAHIPLVKALGWTLVHFFWEGALIALVLAAVVAVCRSAQARYGAACLAMLAMLAAFCVTLAVSVPAEQAVRLPRPVANGAVPGDGSGMAGLEASTLSRVEKALPWAVPFWMAGALLMGLYRLAGWMAAQRMRRAGVCAAPPWWQERFGQLARRLGVSKPVALLESSLAEVPVVIGYLRPVILVPAGLVAGLPAEQFEAILLHELAHIRRFDYLVNLVQTLVEGLLFYHPAVWWVSALIRTERENCCDDVVVEVQGDARGYAAALVTLEERRCARYEPALAATGGKLMNRIRRLLNQPEPPRAAAPLLFSVALLLCLPFFFTAAQQPKSETQAKRETPYQKWLNEDVVYIITNRERAAFQGLATDEEREHFIEQFWLRRDPTPGTPENEFKQEHYRRIAYANEHFSTGIPGWKTDRGRIYIIYGPPDEIDNHPDMQRWQYRLIEGIGKDVIIEFAGPEYRMTMDPAGKGPRK